MSRYYNDDRSGTPLAAVSAVAFLILAGATGTAFFAVSEGVFEPAPSAHLYAFSPEAANPPQPDSSLSASLDAPANAPLSTPARDVDMVETSSVEPEAAEAALCDIDACMAAYRSFRPSDCTFQPYDGPRRLCTR